MKNERKVKKEDTGLLPALKKDVGRFLTNEEAKISAKGLISGSVVIFGLGVMADVATAHTSHSSHGVAAHHSVGSHVNASCFQNHANYSPHSSGSTHESQALNHTNLGAAHGSTASHASDADLGIPHTNTNVGGAFSETVTKGALHNDATANYGKHSAGTGHHNVPMGSLHTNTGNGHSSTNPHANATILPHANAAHHGSVSPHTSVGFTHINQSPIICPTHASHGSHGQW